MTHSQEITPIPQPPKQYFGLLGNLPDIDTVNVHPSFAELAKQYGEILQLDLGNGRTVIISTQELCDEIADETRFYKAIANTNYELRNLMGDGIFTSHTRDHSWKVAHRILVPIFGPLAIKAMFPQMMEVASQLILKWDRFGAREELDCVGDFTRLTLDTIALTGFGYRFNSLYSEKTHPFVDSMMFCQVESGRRANRSKLETQLRLMSKHQYFSNIKVMHDICDEIVKDRREHPQDSQDLLGAMLNNKDPETGDQLSDENIRYQMVTFLIAGHETTSGTLGFCLYNLLKHPQTLHAARDEVDRVVGNKPLEAKHLSELKYIEAILRESLRLYPTAPGWSVHCHEKETLLGGKYPVKSDDRILVSLLRMHRDPKVWGQDAEDFRPERMLNGGFEALPPNAWKPFGNGTRACIGRTFALQEATIMLALLLQRFDIEPVDPDYRLDIQSTLTIKPRGLKIRVRRRAGRGIWVGLSTNGEEQTRFTPLPNNGQPLDSLDLKPLHIFYGSNQGTCRSFADRVASEAPSRGFAAKVLRLDDAVRQLSEVDSALFITPSYEGKPPDNAKKFVSWIESKDKIECRNDIEYAVFGVGSSDWASTFHKVPKVVQEQLQRLVGEPLIAMGLGNVAQDVVGDFEDWKDRFWEGLAEKHNMTIPDDPRPKLEVSVKSWDRGEALGEKDMVLGKVVRNEQLAPRGVGYAKRHVEIQLPEGQTYQTGDYLSVLPSNQPELVRRVLRHFGVPEDVTIQVKGANKSFLPTEALPAFILLRDYIELATPISKKQLAEVAGTTTVPESMAKIEHLRTARFEDEVLAKRASILEVLEANPSCKLSFGSFLDMSQPLKPRQYSISSAPSAGNTCSLTFDVLEGRAYFGGGRFCGVASCFLADLEPGDAVHCRVKSTEGPFHLPDDPCCPVVMIATGSGMAPMRGFIQERRQRGQGPCLFYYGCRSADEDFLYRDELEEAEHAKVVTMRPTFSRDSTSFKYVGDRMWAERKEVVDLLDKGAKILLCGSVRKLSHSVNDVLIKIYCEQQGCSQEEARDWLQQQKQDRYATDIFG